MRKAGISCLTQAESNVSSRKSTDIFVIKKSVFYYKKEKNEEDDKSQEELDLLVEQFQHGGFCTMHHRLQNLGFGWNHKQVYRIYKSMDLRNKRKKRLPKREKEPLLRPVNLNLTCSMNFIHDAPECGKSMRSSNIIDHFNRRNFEYHYWCEFPSTKAVSQLE
ncbi:hypothetical protein [Chryseobacterium sp. OSA05B]|uniref:hypothetical protein n=1 Tax=Chryseobacterium sp. OSA05B TaxID=2862650 RepID=UPI001CBD4ACF|nr:hypothetical protein [Chryseobacterium sp. OSA05B]